MKIIITAFFISFYCFSSENYRLGVNMNSYRNGETLELEIQSPLFFKLKDNSRHKWGLFSSFGMNTLSNVSVAGETDLIEETLNLEFAGGLFTNGEFYKDMIFQYGKVALDYILFDDDIDADGALGALIELGLEFRSSFKSSIFGEGKMPLGIYSGLRWRAGFEPIEEINGKPDLIEGISFVFGSRISF